MNLASTVFFSFYSRLPSLFEIAPDISKTFRKMVRHALVQYYTLIFILNIRRRVSFIIAMEISGYLEPSRISTMVLFLQK